MSGRWTASDKINVKIAQYRMRLVAWLIRVLLRFLAWLNNHAPTE